LIDVAVYFQRMPRKRREMDVISEAEHSDSGNDEELSDTKQTALQSAKIELSVNLEKFTAANKVETYIEKRQSTWPAQIQAVRANVIELIEDDDVLKWIENLNELDKKIFKEITERREVTPTERKTHLRNGFFLCLGTKMIVAAFILVEKSWLEKDTGAQPQKKKRRKGLPLIPLMELSENSDDEMGNTSEFTEDNPRIRQIILALLSRCLFGDKIKGKTFVKYSSISVLVAMELIVRRKCPPIILDKEHNNLNNAQVLTGCKTFPVGSFAQGLNYSTYLRQAVKFVRNTKTSLNDFWEHVENSIIAQCASKTKGTLPHSLKYLVCSNFEWSEEMYELTFFDTRNTYTRMTYEAEIRSKGDQDIEMLVRRYMFPNNSSQDSLDIGSKRLVADFLEKKLGELKQFIQEADNKKTNE
jgi:hypothetical protein